MSRLIVFAVAAVILDVFALIDLRYFDGGRIRTMNKLVWALIIIFVPIVGAGLWFLVGRGRGFKRRTARTPVAPDDDPEFLRKIRVEQESEERIRRLEQELADLDGGAPPEGAAEPDLGAKDSAKDAEDGPSGPAAGDGQPGR